MLHHTLPPSRRCFPGALLLTLAAVLAPAAETAIHLLSGPDGEHPVSWDFQVDTGARAGEWATLPVPAHWEMHGFGTYQYGIGDEPGSETGRYRHRFAVPPGWQGRRVRLVFGGTMTDTTVQLNGQAAGPTHRGASEFSYDVTTLLRFTGENLLEVQVDERSSDQTVDAAERQIDAWVFGGIHRPVWMEARPASGIDRIGVDARANGDLRVVAPLTGALVGDRLRATVRLRGANEVLGPPAEAVISDAAGSVELRTTLAGITPWHPERPQLYDLAVELVREGMVLHQVSERIGFRTVELRPGEGIFLNGARILLKGFNRSGTWPSLGRALAPRHSRLDVDLIRELNGNAVIPGHLPCDRHFLDACDEAGVLAIVELPGWHRAYGVLSGRPLLRELVERDRNHPSVILWANGNEGGGNPELDDDFALHDVQRRHVIHPGTSFRAVDCPHYPSWAALRQRQRPGMILLPTEINHSLYDGGGGAGLADLWAGLLAVRGAGGALIWSLHDEGIARSDRGGAIDVAGLRGADGVTGPSREREGSCAAIRAVWSPVMVESPAIAGAGPLTLAVGNRYAVSDLSATRWTWELRRWRRPSDAQAGHVVLAQGGLTGPALAAGARGELRLDLPGDWRLANAVAVAVADADGRIVNDWCWALGSATDMAAAVTGIAALGATADPPGTRVVSTARDDLLRGAVEPPAGAARVSAPTAADPVTTTKPAVIELRGGATCLRLDPATGRALALMGGERSVPLSAGPRLLSGSGAGAELRVERDGDATQAVARCAGDLADLRWRLGPDGWVRLDVRYTANQSPENLGVAFDLPGAELRRVRWLGGGPQRVWRNRLEGAVPGVWELPWRPARPGLAWEYPESDGFYAGVRWLRLETGTGTLLLVLPDDQLFVRLGRPVLPLASMRARIELPPGDLTIQHRIPAMGEKYLRADQRGPTGALQPAVGPYTLRVWMRVE